MLESNFNQIVLTSVKSAMSFGIEHILNYFWKYRYWKERFLEHLHSDYYLFNDF